MTQKNKSSSRLCVFALAKEHRKNAFMRPKMTPIVDSMTHAYFLYTVLLVIFGEGVEGVG